MSANSPPWCVEIEHAGRRKGRVSFWVATRIVADAKDLHMMGADGKKVIIPRAEISKVMLIGSTAHLKQDNPPPSQDGDAPVGTVEGEDALPSSPPCEGDEPC